jgi:hypothetical protein
VDRFDPAADGEAHDVTVDGSLDPQHVDGPATVPWGDQGVRRFTKSPRMGSPPSPEQCAGR